MDLDLLAAEDEAEADEARERRVVRGTAPKAYCARCGRRGRQQSAAAIVAELIGVSPRSSSRRLNAAWSARVSTTRSFSGASPEPARKVGERGPGGTARAIDSQTGKKVAVSDNLRALA